MNVRKMFCSVVCSLALFMICQPFTLSAQTAHGTLKASDMDQLNNGTVRFDLAAIRLNPSLLKNKNIMQYFIGLNNCHDQQVNRALQNELDYPDLAKYYESHAAAILAALPDTAGLAMFVGNTKGGKMWGKAFGGYDPKLKTLSLGEYDTERNVFPIVVNDGSPSFEVSGAQHTNGDRVSLQNTCPVAYDAMIRAQDWTRDILAGYNTTVKPMSFKELPLSKDEARKFIEASNSTQRPVFLGVDVHLSDLSDAPNHELNFNGTIARIFVISSNSHQIVGTLYDDGNLAHPVIKTAPTALTTMKTPDDVTLELNTIVYVSLASRQCGWPIPSEQDATIKRFESDINTYGRFNDKYKLNATIGTIQNILNSHPGFCRVPSERAGYDKKVATIYPSGPYGTPAK